MSADVASLALSTHETRTTVLLKTLPKGWTGLVLAEKLDEEGYAGLYDFVYVPLELQNGACFGHAFVNITSAHLAVRFMEKYHGAAGWAEDQKLKVQWSEHQGLDWQIEKYRNSSVMHESVGEEARPLLFANGVNVPFPEPTETINKPKNPRWRRIPPC